MNDLWKTKAEAQFEHCCKHLDTNELRGLFQAFIYISMFNGYFEGDEKEVRLRKQGELLEILAKKFYREQNRRKSGDPKTKIKKDWDLEQLALLVEEGDELRKENHYLRMQLLEAKREISHD